MSNNIIGSLLGHISQVSASATTTAPSSNPIGALLGHINQSFGGPPIPTEPPPAPKPAAAAPPAAEEQSDLEERAQISLAKLKLLEAKVNAAAAADAARHAEQLKDIRSKATREAHLQFQNELGRTHRKRVLKKLRKGG